MTILIGLTVLALIIIGLTVPARAARASAERKQQHDEMMRALGHAPKLDTSLWSKRDREAYEKKHSK